MASQDRGENIGGMSNIIATDSSFSKGNEICRSPSKKRSTSACRYAEESGLVEASSCQDSHVVDEGVNGRGMPNSAVAESRSWGRIWSTTATALSPGVYNDWRIDQRAWH